MPSSVVRNSRSVVIDTAITAADTGLAGAAGIELVLVGGAGEPNSIYITAMYTVAGVNGQVDFFQSPAGTGEDKGVLTMIFPLYATTTGDGITGITVGPITSDLYAGSDATFTCLVSDLVVTYEEV